MTIAALDEGAPPLEFTCPRCGTAAAERLYGPCTTCRQVLRSAVAAARGDNGEDVAPPAGASAYEPKMNVVPNQVATKD